MNLQKLLDNDYFQDLLNQADEYAVQCAGMYFVPYKIQQNTLRENEEFFHDWLAGNYPDFGFTETEDPNLLNSEIALFLSTQSREEKMEIYRDFMTSYGVIEDLMCLDLDERLELVMELGVG
ncbi:MAG TPA: hypothetical protein DEF82_06295 [Crocinitomicaceae bacterium]|nr:hypothetical protein [Flavobacteriales bacterium]HBW86350.1 hypothetical protein [Crocinitomicaceae bacterium]